MKLSDILDYILYRIDTPKIAISNEIKIIENYIELEKIRFSNTYSGAYPPSFRA